MYIYLLLSAVPCLSRASDIEKYDPKSEFALGGDDEGWVATHQDPAAAGTAAAGAAADDIPDLDDTPAAATTSTAAAGSSSGAAAASSSQPAAAAAAAASDADEDDDDDVPDISDLELIEPEDEVSWCWCGWLVMAGLKHQHTGHCVALHRKPTPALPAQQQHQTKTQRGSCSTTLSHASPDGNSSLASLNQSWI